MTEDIAVLMMTVGALALLFACAAGVSWLLETTDPRPPRSGLMSELYRSGRT